MHNTLVLISNLALINNYIFLTVIILILFLILIFLYFLLKVNDLRITFRSQITKDLNFRRDQLKAFLRMINENEKRIVSALHQDLNKCEFESNFCEITLLKNELRLMIDNLNKFAKNRPVQKNMASLFDSVFIKPEPLGVILIISAWNYPIYLTLTPLVGAIAAGNCAIIKPSELAPASAKLMEELVKKFLDQVNYFIFYLFIFLNINDS